MPKPAHKPPKTAPKDKSLESRNCDAACSIRGAKDAPKYKDYILPLIFTKRLCDVFDDEFDRIAAEVGSRKKAFQLAKADHTARRDSALRQSEGTPQIVSEAKDNRVRFYFPLVPDDPEQPVWSVIRKLSDQIGEGVTTHMRASCSTNEHLHFNADLLDLKQDLWDTLSSSNCCISPSPTTANSGKV